MEENEFFDEIELHQLRPEQVLLQEITTITDELGIYSDLPGQNPSRTVATAEAEIQKADESNTKEVDDPTPALFKSTISFYSLWDMCRK